MDPASGPTDRRPIGFWLKLVDRLIDDSFDALLGEAGLTRRHWQVLNVLRTGPATVEQVDRSVAPFLGGEESTTGPVLSELRGRGWVAWTDGEPATLTEAGAAAQAELLTKVSDSRLRLTAGITADEYRATVEVLRRMAVNLGWVEPADDRR
jgi:DNA-binding MarR family transcriptional regulator